MRKLHILKKKNSRLPKIGISSNLPEFGQFVQVWVIDNEIWSQNYKWFDDILGCYCPHKDDWVEAKGNYALWRDECMYIIIPEEE